MANQVHFEFSGIVDIVDSDRATNTVTFKLRAESGRSFIVSYRGFCPINEGDSATVCVRKGEGEQYVAVRMPFVQLLSDRESIIKCFCRALSGRNKSGKYKGFSEDSASRLYDHLEVIATSAQTNVVSYLGETAMEGKRDRRKIAEVSKATGINIDEITKLLNWWHQKRSLRRLWLLGLTNKEINHGESMDKIYDTCLSNPYVLPWLSMEKCEAIRTLLKPVTKRVTTKVEWRCGLIVRKVYEMCHKRGWTCTPARFIKTQFPDYQDAEIQRLLFSEYQLSLEFDSLYLAYPLRVERRITEYVHQAIIRTAEQAAVAKPLLKNSYFECKTLTEEQKQSIHGALSSRISVITGGAGVGKTLVIREILHNLDMRQVAYEVGSFTGKSVARIREVTGSNRPATLDQMISRPGREKFFHVIIDETSMVTTELFYRFITTFAENEFSITFVGDCNQLPPIGWGSLMRELIASQRVPIFYLSQNHRILPQLASITPEEEATEPSETIAPANREFDRGILVNANALIQPNRDYTRPIEFINDNGFYQLDGDMGVIEDAIRHLHSSHIETERFTIITPYNDCLKDLNAIVQKIYLSEAPVTTDKLGRVWYIGDRVMMTKNNYTINVMNGEEGTVTRLEPEGISVQFKDGAEHRFAFLEPLEKEDEDVEESENLHCGMIQHSFAITIHKSQGSEREFVILFIPNRGGLTGGEAGSRFLNVNLLYTAITRTRRTIWVVGDRLVIQRATRQKQAYRFENLARRLRDLRNVELEKVLLPTTQAKPEVAVTAAATPMPPATMFMDDDDYPCDDGTDDY